MSNVLITVITVCLNAEKEIGYTVNSILEQDFAGFEYLIKDGGSGDRTVGIAESYAERFGEKNIAFRVVSEKDEGIYDAMNKAADMARGEWVMYMNAGDALFDKNVLTRISSMISADADVIYGDAVYLENGRYKLLRAGSEEDFKYSNPICHQACITRTDAVREFRFYTGYKISADFDMFLRMYGSGDKRFKKIDDTLCVFLLGGTSDDLIFEREKEFDVSRKRNGHKRVPFPRMQIIKFSVLYGIRSLAKKLLGTGFYSERRGWFAEKEKAVAAGEENA